MGAAWKIISALVLAGACIAGTPALAQKRVALVIGNSAYQKVAPLSNPANDASVVAAMLKQAGFDSVDSKMDLKAADMRRALREFGNKTRDAEVAVIYYAGHGIEVDNTNYLIPVDAQLETDTDVYDETFPLDRVLVAVEPARQLRLVILDACRDNPFSKTMRRTVASRAIGRGLAKVEPASPNTLIAFAAKAGSTASDGNSKNSPYAIAVVEHLPKPGLDLRRAFGFVRDDVLKSTGNKQEPFLYGSLGGNDVPLVAAKPAATGPQADPQATVRRNYELAMQVGDREVWEGFLRTYPEGFYADLAKGQLRRIAAEEVRAAATEKARLAEQEKARLAADGAKQADVAKAVAVAKAAEDTRIAAEKAKLIEQEKAAAAEKARLAAEKAAAEKKQTAAVSPADKPEQSAVDLPRALQAELRRVGCNTGAVDGNWTAASQKSLDLFNRRAGMKLDLKAASIDALEAVKGKSGRVCPLTCGKGFKAVGESCTKITCQAGFQLNESNTCEPTAAGRKRRSLAITTGDDRSNTKPGDDAQTNVPLSCSTLKDICVREAKDASGCYRAFAHCRKTGVHIGPETGRAYRASSRD